MVQAPIFHVNGDDPEAVVHAVRIATEFRQLFHKDVVLDMICYRRFGHNETDEPAFTQPLMYRAIKDHPTTLTLYSQKLVAEGRAQAHALLAEARTIAEKERALAMEKTRQEQEELLERARRDLAAERDRAIVELRREAVDLSLAAASKLISERLGSETDRKLVEQYLAGVDAKH